MESRVLIRFALLGLLWAGLAGAPLVPPAQAQGTPLPSNINATMARILAIARKNWHPDAIITSVEMKWYPTDDLDAPGVMHWLEIQANSPSTSARRYFYVGKPYDGTVTDEPPDHDGSTIDHALPASIALDLPAAVAYLRKVGLDRKSTRLNSSHLRTSRMPSSA